MPMNHDRRQAQRLFTPLPVALHWQSAHGKEVQHDAQAVDISVTGMALRVRGEGLPLHCRVQAVFSLPRHEAVLDLSAEVARIEASHGHAGCELGLQFIDPPAAALKALQEYITGLAIGPLLAEAIKRGASDLHLLADQTPMLRINGQLQPLSQRIIPAADLPPMVFSLLAHEQVQRFEHDHELDLGVQYDATHRFRLNVHQQRGMVEAAFRLINPVLASFAELRLPGVIENLCKLREGLVLIAGPTGSGKTTTIAAMVDYLNRHRTGVIVTLERPIEYLHANRQCIIKQREVGVDTHSFAAALKASLRQDPDVIVIGEIDDAETVRTALVAAETGYLVIASFHAPNTIAAIDRFAALLPVESRRQTLAQLGQSLRAVVSQVLLPRSDQPGRVLASEVLTVSTAVRHIVRSDELYRLPTVIQMGAAQQMLPLQDSLRRLVEAGLVEPEQAAAYSGEVQV
ncbi:MAG TPA: PilT/PilU family type 4a pilus ATPase [bacterium]|nr:PilT/PilU family type 4a pilus ATPase [bacterium]